MKVLVISWTNVVRMLRDRSNIFFVLIFPLGLIFLIGLQFGGGVRPEVGVYGTGPMAEGLVAGLDASEDVEVRTVGSIDALEDDVTNGVIALGVIVPDNAEETLLAGSPVEIGMLTGEDDDGVGLEPVVVQILSDEAMVPGIIGSLTSAADADSEDVDDEEIATTVAALAEIVPPIEVEATVAGEAIFPSGLGQFDVAAPQILVLFVFLTTLAGSAALIQSRQLGVSRRMMATPTSTATVVLGEGAGRWAVGMFQGVYIVVVTLVLFRVEWGDPLAAFVLLAVLAAVGAGAAMLVGATLANDQQAAGIGVMVGLGLAALGGSMFPLELFPPTMLTVAHFTPHAWALDGFAELVRHDGTVIDILPEIGVLAAFAAVLLVLAAWRLRITLTSV